MKPYHNSFFAMGTRFNALFASDDHNICEEVFNDMRGEVLRIEDRLNYFNSASDLSVLNNNAFNEAVFLDDELFEIIQTCLYFSTLTNGAFDITMRSLSSSYKSADYIYQPLADKLFINSINRSFKLKEKHAHMDFGACAKGYAIERMLPIISNAKIGSGLISFGESSIHAIGKRPDGNEWLIGIKDLFNPDIFASQFALCNKSISISSNWFVDDNHQLINKKHIINPFTLQSDEAVTVAAVCADSAVTAEILSTALLVMKTEEIDILLKELHGISAIKIEYVNKLPVIIHLGVSS